MVRYTHLFKNFPECVVVHIVIGFGTVNKAEVDVFLELSSFFDNTTDVDDFISGSSAFSRSSLNIWKFMVHELSKPGLKNFEHYFACVWDEYNCTVVWALFGIAFLRDWNENWLFPVLWPLLSFLNLLAYWDSLAVALNICKATSWEHFRMLLSGRHLRTYLDSHCVRLTQENPLKQNYIWRPDVTICTTILVLKEFCL